jgi:hypothetical protein
MNIGHIEIFVQVLIEFILNFVGDWFFFDGGPTVFILDWEYTLEISESYELWVCGIFI